MKTIKVPEVIWALGDREQHTTSGVTISTRPIYYKGRRVGEIDPDYAEPLMSALLKVKQSVSPVLASSDGEQETKG